MSFSGTRFSRRLKDVDIKQHELAVMLNVNQATVSRYANGATAPGIDTLIEIAKILDCSTDYLLEMSDDIGGAQKPEYRLVKDNAVIYNVRDSLPLSEEMPLALNKLSTALSNLDIKFYLHLTKWYEAENSDGSKAKKEETDLKVSYRKRVILNYVLSTINELTDMINTSINAVAGLDLPNSRIPTERTEFEELLYTTTIRIRVNYLAIKKAMDSFIEDIIHIGDDLPREAFSFPISIDEMIEMDELNKASQAHEDDILDE